MKKYLILKNNRRLECKNRYPIYDQNGGKIAKIDTQFMTKRAENHTLQGLTYLYCYTIGKYPPPPGRSINNQEFQSWEVSNKIIYNNFHLRISNYYPTLRYFCSPISWPLSDPSCRSFLSNYRRSRSRIQKLPNDKQL